MKQCLFVDCITKRNKTKSKGCSPLNSRSKVEVHPTFDAAFYKILNAIGDIHERTSRDKVLLCVSNTFL